MKTCTKCGVEKPYEEYYGEKRTADGRKAWCIPCHNADYRARYAKDSARHVAASVLRNRVPENRIRRITNRHHLTIERYTELVEAGCGVCGQEFDIRSSEGNASVDHDHACCPGEYSCGKCVRAVLCRGCNWMLGQAKDNPERLEAGAAYLRRHLTPWELEPAA